MEHEKPNPLDNIWAGDLLDRRSEAELLAGYISSVFDRPGLRRNDSAYTIAIDADYGAGKTYFLQRLAQHLSNTHPVAYIDAWKDDLADQPLVALMATLKAALSPVLGDPEIKKGWSKLAKKSGQVAKIVALGAAKRGLGLLISHTAAEALTGILKQPDDDLKEDAEEAIKDTSEEALDDVVKGLKFAGDMEAQVTDFETAQAAMEEMKHSLLGVVQKLPKNGISTPIVIIIDELDRCRPTYAVKVLEEIKHLFDVPGVVFILGLHGNQLARAVEGIYGPNFDGKSYLRRFINRRYNLSFSSRQNLIAHLVTSAGISNKDFHFTHYYKKTNSGHLEQNGILYLIDFYTESFNLTPRDLFHLVDLIETAISVVRPNQLIAQYFLPLLIGHMRGLPAGESPNLSTHPDIVWVSNMGNTEYYPSRLFDELKRLSNLSRSDVMRAYNSNEAYPEAIVADAWDRSSSNAYASPINYPRLINAVSKFSKD